MSVMVIKGIETRGATWKEDIVWHVTACQYPQNATLVLSTLA